MTVGPAGYGREGDAGYDHRYSRRIGPAPQAFLDVWARELAAALPA